MLNLLLSIVLLASSSAVTAPASSGEAIDFRFESAVSVAEKTAVFFGTKKIGEVQKVETSEEGDTLVSLRLKRQLPKQEAEYYSVLVLGSRADTKSKVVLHLLRLRSSDTAKDIHLRGFASFSELFNYQKSPKPS